MDFNGDEIGWFLAITGIGLSIFLYLKGRKFKRFSYHIENDIFISDEIEVAKLNVTFNRKKQSNISIAKIILLNTGTIVISNDDISKISPLKIETSNEFEILDQSIIYTNKENSDLFLEKIDKRSFKVNIQEFLNSGEGVIIKILHTGKSANDLRLFGSIRGIKKYNNMRPNKRYVLKLISTISGIFGIYMGVWLIPSIQPFTKKFTFFIVLLIGVIVIRMLVLLFQYTTSIRSKKHFIKFTGDKFNIKHFIKKLEEL